MEWDLASNPYLPDHGSVTPPSELDRNSAVDDFGGSSPGCETR